MRDGLCVPKEAYIRENVANKKQLICQYILDKKYSWDKVSSYMSTAYSIKWDKTEWISRNIAYFEINLLLLY